MIVIMAHQTIMKTWLILDDDKNVECLICNAVLPGIRSFIKHNNMVHGQGLIMNRICKYIDDHKKYIQCLLCAEVFFGKEEFVTHAAGKYVESIIEEGKPVYKCRTCQAFDSELYTLLLHLECHTTVAASGQPVAANEVTN